MTFRMYRVADSHRGKPLVHEILKAETREKLLEMAEGRTPPGQSGTEVWYGILERAIPLTYEELRDRGLPESLKRYHTGEAS